VPGASPTAKSVGSGSTPLGRDGVGLDEGATVDVAPGREAAGGDGGAVDA
jgi:hypothetical protein